MPSVRASLARLAFLAFLAACNAGVTAPAPGHERGACKADDTCDPGLECWSQVCVRPPGADCLAVGERLASERLGNYASQGDRKPVVRQLTAICDRAHLSSADGKCIIEATTHDDLAACPRPLLPELEGDPKGCARVGAAAVALARHEIASHAQLQSLLREMIDGLGPAVTAACTDDRWPYEVKQCLTAATSYTAGEACIARLPSDDRSGLERRLAELLYKRSGATFPPTTPSNPSTVSVPSTGNLPDSLPGECRDYLALMSAYGECPTFPESARESIRSAVRQTRDAWAAFPTLPPDTRVQVASSCQQGADALRSAMQQLSCPLPARP